MNREEEDNIDRAIKLHEYPYDEKELPEISDGDLLYHYRWAQKELKNAAAKRDAKSTKKEGEPLQDYITVTFTYLHLLQKEFDKRKLDLPTE